jgi:hypothetical protein
VVIVYKRYGIATATKPFKTIHSLVFHPKDRLNRGETGECVYKIPCKNCERVTSKKLAEGWSRMKEHRQEVEQQSRKFTRSTRQVAEWEQNKSAITDNVRREKNHVIDWDEAAIIDREGDMMTRWIREVISIRKHNVNTMNHDAGAYQLSHVYDKMLSVVTSSGERSSTTVRQRQQVLSKRHWCE